MTHSWVPADTDPRVLRMLATHWRTMGITERVELVEQLCVDAERVARAGILAMHPEYTEMQVTRELTRRRYGDAVTDAAYAAEPARG